MKKQLLLLEDLYGVGYKGDIVAVAPGFARNYLLPQQKAVIAQPHLVKLQARLKEERAKQAVVDKKESEELAQFFEGKQITTKVKVDPEGHMYGSVSAADVAQLIKEQLNKEVDRRFVLLPKGIKTTGLHLVELRLKEGVMAKVCLEINAEASE